MSRWLKRLGLQAPAQDPDAWTPIVTDQLVDDPATGTSNIAARIIEVLASAGIEAQQRPYVVPHQPKLNVNVGVLADPGPDAADRLRVSVLVHNRDLERATALPELQKELNRQQEPYPVSDEELTRQSLQAGEEPGRGTIDGN